MYIDGAARGNPGPAGAGIYIQKNKTEVERHSVYLGTKTNNQAEYLALALGLFFVRRAIQHDATSPLALDVVSDSELLVRQMSGEYRVKNEGIASLHVLIRSLMAGMHCTFRHVMREQNKIADKLANKGVDGKGAIPNEFLNILTHHNIHIV